jgi:hypothetical protein
MDCEGKLEHIKQVVDNMMWQNQMIMSDEGIIESLNEILETLET